MKKLIILLLAIFFLVEACQKEEKQYFNFLYKSSVPHDFEASEVTAKRSDNLITIDANGYTITLPKDISPGTYTQASPNVYFTHGDKLTTFKLSILEVNKKAIRGTFEGRFTYGDKSYYDLENGKFYAKFIKE